MSKIHPSKHVKCPSSGIFIICFNFSQVERHNFWEKWCYYPRVVVFMDYLQSESKHGWLNNYLIKPNNQSLVILI